MGSAWLWFRGRVKIRLGYVNVYVYVHASVWENVCVYIFMSIYTFWFVVGVALVGSTIQTCLIIPYIIYGLKTTQRKRSQAIEAIQD